MTQLILAAYLRLSSSDAEKEEQNESNSIKNQRLLIQNYLSCHPEFQDMPYREYVDDGYTGTNTKRPAFQKLLSHVRAGKIGTVIVKDMSRFSREFIVLGDYVEQIFPMLHVRFLSINDHYDSASSLLSPTDTMNAAIQSLVYDYYSRDLSKKRCLSVKSRMKNGKFIGPAPYGYVSNYQEHCYEIDPEAAQVVRTIFQMATDGKRPTAIANFLNSKKISPPGKYNSEHPELKKTGKHYKTAQPLWNYHTISRILKDPVYYGTLELGKSYESQPMRTGQKDRSVITIEHAHEPIITNELFEKARKAQEYTSHNLRKRSSLPVETPLAGFLSCGYCGLKMHYRPAGKTTYCQRSFMPDSICPRQSYPLQEIETYVWKRLRTMQRSLICLREEREEKIEKGKHQLSHCRQKLAFLAREQENSLEEKRKIFEAYMNGSLTKEGFLKQKQNLSAQTERIALDTSILKKEEDALASLEIPPDLIRFSDYARDDLLKDALTKELLQTYVDTILIYGPHDYQIKWKQSIQAFYKGGNP